MTNTKRHKCNAPTVWEEVGPSSVHAYRVTCVLCRKLIQWGTADQLTEAQSRGDVLKVLAYEPAATLEPYFEHERVPLGR